MSHPKLLHYFDSKDDLILTYVKYTKDYMTEHCMNWFATHDRKDYDSNLAFMNDFMHYVAEAPEGELRPNATTQTYVLGHYKEESCARTPQRRPMSSGTTRKRSGRW